METQLGMDKHLIKYGYNKYSQNGEDGIIAEVCQRLGITTGWFVEFGAWDGKHLSNTYNLLSNHDWRGVHIEGNEERYQQLLLTKASFPERLHTLCAMVDVQGENKLDNLLSRTPTPHDFDLLSIDIDSIDWQIWNSLTEYRPKIVIIECNMVLPPGVLQLHDPPRHVGASFSSLVELGRKKGYQLVCQTGNCLFVLKELLPALHLDPSLLASPEKMFNHAKHYRERILSVGRRVLPPPIMRVVFNASSRWKDLMRRR
jgi:hypothetical protein